VQGTVVEARRLVGGRRTRLHRRNGSTPRGWRHSPNPKKFRDRPRALAYAPLMRCPVTCPNCDKTALRLLEHWSIRTSLDYWCCDMCGHVTAATKDFTDVAGQLPKPKPLPAPPFVPATSDRRRAS